MLKKDGVKLVFGVTEREVGKKERKTGRRLRGIFHLELFIRITFPFSGCFSCSQAILMVSQLSGKQSIGPGQVLGYFKVTTLHGAPGRYIFFTPI